MARPRKRHIQQSLLRDKNGQRRGLDKHRRPGRPKPKGKRPSERHKTRPMHRAREPLHVTLRVTDPVGKLRRRSVYLAIRKAMVTSFQRSSFRIVHMSIQRNHVHLLVGLIGSISIQEQCRSWKKYSATSINRVLCRRGRFWQEESFDHLVRNSEQFEYFQRYIAENPLRAGLRSGEFLYCRREKT